MRWLVLAATWLAAAGAGGHAGGYPPPGSPPRPDADAPHGAPAHWLPSEAWVHNHWLPFDEARFERLLGIDREVAWRHLRDDRRALAVLARRRGWTVPRLARALVAPRDVPRSRRRVLVARAKRLLTQGHLSQHVLFHSLHQEVLPARARELFGVSPARWRELRRLDLAPLEIARATGRGRAEVTDAAEAALRGMLRRGLVEGAVSRRQARLLLDRQLRQLPRWLEQRRYNGPPPTDERGRPTRPGEPHAILPSISADGKLIAFEQAQPAVPVAVREGEIAVQVRDAEGMPAGSPAKPAPGAPCSAYSAHLASGGRVAVLETAAGNRTFAKRYGRPGVVRVDLDGGRARPVSPAGATAYHPSVDADGFVIAFSLVRTRGPRAQVAVSRAGRVEVLPGVAHEPAVSGDGRTLAVVRRERQRTVIALRDLASGRERRVRAPGGADAGEPALSHDGSVLAFTAGARVHVVRDGRRTALPGRHAHSPAVSPDGRIVALAQRLGPVAARAGSGRPRQTIAVHDLASGARTDVAPRVPSRSLAHPALDANGGRLAFSAVVRGGVQAVGVLDLLGTESARRVSGAPGLTGALSAPCAVAAPAW